MTRMKNINTPILSRCGREYSETTAMKIISPQDWIIFLTDSFYTGYFFFGIICLLSRFISRGKIRREFTNIHAVVNLGMAIGSVLALISLATEFYAAWNLTSGYERFAFSRTSLNIFEVVFFIMLAGLVAGLLFFIRRWQASMFLSLLVLILLNAGTILSWITRQRRDYLPAEWEKEDNNLLLVVLQVLLFGVITLVIYWRLARRKKLPYTSAWIR